MSWWRTKPKSKPKPRPRSAAEMRIAARLDGAKRVAEQRAAALAQLPADTSDTVRAGAEFISRLADDLRTAVENDAAGIASRRKRVSVPVVTPEMRARILSGDYVCSTGEQVQLVRKVRAEEAARLAALADAERSKPDTFPHIDGGTFSRVPMTAETWKSAHPFTQRRLLAAYMPGSSMGDVERARKLLDANPRSLAANVRNEILKRRKLT